MDNNLNFKFGQYANLPTASANTAGTIFVTTDEQAMYIDLPSASDSTKVGRIRIGDIIVCENLSDLQPPYHEGAFYYVASKNALLRYQPKAFDSDGNPVKDTATGKVVYGWTQINSLTSVQQAIENLQAEVDALGDTDDEILEAMNLLLPTDTFTEFQEQYANDLETISGTISDTAEAIRGEIAAEVEEINAAIEGAKEAYEAADADLQDQINDKVDTDTYTTKIGEIEENISDLNTSLSDTAEAIRGEIAAEVEELDAAIEGVKESYAAADTGLQNQINNKVNTSDYNTKIGEIEEDIEVLSAGLADTADTIRGEISTQRQEINAAIEGVQEAYEAADVELQNQINNKVEANDYNIKIGEIEEDISELSGTLDQTAEAIRGEIATEVEELDAAIEGVKEAYVAADEGLQEQIDDKVDIDTYTEKIEEINEDISSLSGNLTDTAEAIRGEIAAEVEELDAAIEGVKEAYTEADAGLQEQINDKVDTDTYTTKIGEIEENITNLSNTLDNTAEAIRGEIAAEVEELDAAIEGVKEAYAAADEDLQDQINNKVDSDTYATKIGEIEEDISDLSDILDNTAAAIRGEIDTEVKDINAAIDGVKEAYLMRNGDLSITGDLTFETAGTITNIKNPEGNTDAANKLYVDTSISSAIAGVNAMTLKGSVGAEDGLPKASDKPQTGDTYIVSSAKSYITEYDTNGKSKVKVDAKIGDLFINTGADDETPIWVHVASGYNESYLQRFVIGTDTVSGKQLPYIAITDGIDTDTANEEGRIYFEGSSNTNLNFSIAADSNDTTNRNFIVTASLAWGTFDPEPETTEPESGVLPGEPQ